MHDFMTITNIVAEQFPDFYRENGQMFMAFVNAYYEWLEEDGNVLDLTHKLHTFRDVDQTLDKFLDFFNKEYLFGIPAQIKGDKRFLVKHVLDVYRAKGTMQGYKLLFRLLYNEDIDVYLPQVDMLKPSDGVWFAPSYLEVTSNPLNATFVGNRIKGSASGAEAIVEDYVVQYVNGRIVEMLFIGSISGSFQQGEKVVNINDFNSVATLNAPSIIGSVVGLSIIDGGINFNIGDVLIALDGSGRELEFRVAATGNGAGSLFFYLESGGTYYTMDAVSIVTRPDHNGTAGHFNIGSLSSVQSLTYDGNLLLTTNMSQALNSTNYNIGGTTTANSSTVLSSAITFTTKDFGTIASLTNVVTGNGYNVQPTIDVKDFLYSANLAGTISFSNTAATVNGTSTTFTTDFTVGSFIRIKIVNGASSYFDHRKVVAIANNTQLTVDDYVNVNTAVTSSSYTRAYPLIDTVFDRAIVGQGGNNAVIRVSAQFGTGVVTGVEVKNSGIGYNDGETINLVTTGAISNVVVSSIGFGYQNNQPLVFAGGSPVSTAAGYIRTYANSSIANVTLTSAGSGYQTAPTVKIISATGHNGLITAGISGLNNSVIVKGAITKTGIGKTKGQFTSTRGFLNSDKYITDSYYYQDFSYEVQAPVAFEEYVDIIKKVFHPAGIQPFGKVVQRDTVSVGKTLVSESITQA